MKNGLRIIISGLMALILATQPLLAAELNNSSTGKWSETDSSNTSPSPDGWPAGTYFNQVEPIGQSTMGSIKRFWDRINCTVTSGGSANAYTYTPTNSSYPTAYVTGETYCFLANFANTGASTFNASSVGAKNIYQPGTTGPVALAGGEIKIGQPVQLTYDGTEMVMLSPAANGGSSIAGTYAPLASPVFTGTPSLPTGTTGVTQTAGNNTTALATTAFVTAATAAAVHGEQLFTSSGTFTTPASTISSTIFKFTITAAGGGSGGSTGSGAGAGAGSTCIYYATGLSASQNITVTIGAQGTAGASSPSDGGDGGNSSIVVGATTVTAPGGKHSPAASGTSFVPPGNGGGACTNAFLSLAGGGGSHGALNTAGQANFTGAGGSSFWGGGGRGLDTPNEANTAGQAGQAPGSGAGGAAGTATGGLGGIGLVLVEY